MQQFPLKFVIGTAGIIIASVLAPIIRDFTPPDREPISPPKENSGTGTPPSLETRYAVICGSEQSLIEPGKSNIDIKWSLKWKRGGFIYEATLEMQGNSGEMIVMASDLNDGGLRFVSQTMQLYNSPRGLFLLGSNPVDPKTQNPSQNYAADNFLIRVENNKLTITNCDNAGNNSPVSIQSSQ
ncbi:MAG: hypothetical protein QNJ74_07580 [Trichodesmium sp. MO_231.B1]|nr:hypothetical protein [Trichodesmium sp. MO_231.B1]